MQFVDNPHPCQVNRNSRTIVGTDIGFLAEGPTKNGTISALLMVRVMNNNILSVTSLS